MLWITRTIWLQIVGGAYDGLPDDLLDGVSATGRRGGSVGSVASSLRPMAASVGFGTPVGLAFEDELVGR